MRISSIKRTSLKLTIGRELDPHDVYVIVARDCVFVTLIFFWVFPCIPRKLYTILPLLEK
jgi:hypothetical protein